MSLKKIIRKNIEDNAVTEPKLANEAVTAEKLGTDFITGLTELTSVAEDDNLMIYDTSAGVLKKVSKSNTTSLTSPTFSSVSPDNSQTADGGNITFTITGSGFTAGTNARLIGASGQRLNFTSVTRTSTTSITATIARSSLLQAQSPYGIQVINGEGLAVTTASLITVDNIPVFNTAAGSLGTFTEGDSIDIEVSAYDPDSTSGITYELQSGSLPAGLSLVNESGDSCRIQGTASAVDADTTSNFILRATDSASNTTSRAFSITIEDFTLNGLRFDSNSGDYLNRTPSSASNRKTFTISTWAKLCKFDTTGYTIIGAGNSSSGEDGEWVLKIDNFGRDGQLIVQTGPTVILETTQALRDPSAWYHIVIAVDTTSATSGDRVRMYINGSEVTAFDAENQPSQNQDFAVNNNVVHEIGRFPRITSQNFDGYLSEFHLIDGSQLSPSSFGETDSNGVWIPKAYSGSFGTNGFHLDFADGADLGNDVSGNNNDFTEQAITSIDKVEDTPQNNYATLNPLDVRDDDGRTLSEGNLNFTTSSGNNSEITSTIAVSGSGKWYFETKISAQSGAAASSAKYGIVGVRDLDKSTPYSAGNAYYIYSDGRKEDGANTTSSAHPGYSLNDIVQVALDLDNGNIYFGLNGNWGDNSGNFNQTFGNATAFFTSINTSGFWAAYLNKNVTADNTLTLSANFGNPAFTISSGNSDANGYGNFEYAVPSGYFALNSKNLAEYG